MKLSLFTLILLCFFYVPAQELDSLTIALEDKINTAESDVLKIPAMLELGEYHLDKNFTKAKRLIYDAHQLLEHQNEELIKDAMANALSLKGIIARREGNYVESLDYYYQSKRLYEQLQDSVNISSVLHNMGMVHRFNDEPRKSIGLYQASIDMNNRFANRNYEVACSYNMMGVAYKQLKQKDSALWCYNKAIAMFGDLHKQEDVYRAKNNVANLYRMDKAYSKALGSKISLANSYYNISTVYKNLKQYSVSMKYADSSLKMAKAEGLKQRISKVYLRKSYLFAQLNDYKGAYDNYRKFNRAADSIFNIENVKKLQALELNHKFEQERLQLETEKKAVEVIAKSEAKEKKLYILLSVLALLSSGIIVFLIYKVYQTRTLVISEKLEKEEIQKAFLHKKVNSKEEEIKRLIADNSMRLHFKEELLEQLKSKLESRDPDQLKQSLDSMAKDLQSQINTENKLSTIQHKIDEVNEGFDARLRYLYPELTKTEREICHLLRLNLSIKEMMVIRRASVDAIKSVRYRIRKKMGLSSKDELEKFIQNLE